MANGSTITSKGDNIVLYRAYTANGDLSSTLYTAPSKIQLGILNGTPSIGSTTLDQPIPYADGTVNDNGDNTLTGSSGGDNTTDNTSIYKEGAGTTDVTAQNLIANGTSTTKIWTISNLASLGTNIDASQYGSMWLYIKDSTALAKIVSAQLKLGSDTSNYYSTTVLVANLSVGWNFITTANIIISDWTETGTVAGDVDTFIIEIVTNNSSDTFVAGDVVYDLLRTWTLTDTKLSFVSGYPTFDYATNNVTIRGLVNTLQANGFDINGTAIYNEDTTPLLASEDTISAESKSLTDEFAFVYKNRIL